MAGSVEKYTLTEVKNAIKAAHGLVYLAAQKLGCSSKTIQNYVNRHPEIKECLHEAREAMVDRAEASLFQKVTKGDAWAVQFMLKTRGKNRGYVERVEHVNVDENNLNAAIERELERVAGGGEAADAGPAPGDEPESAGGEAAGQEPV